MNRFFLIALVFIVLSTAFRDHIGTFFGFGIGIGVAFALVGLWHQFGRRGV